MATELAAAYVTLIPSLRGAESQIASELSGMTPIVNREVQKMSGTLGSELKVLGAGVTGVIGSITGGLASMAMAGGISRAIKIDDANAKLEQLGMNVNQIRDDALYAVKGTRFGLDEATNAAVLLGSSGIEAGDDMKKALESVASVASVAGTSMEAISPIFAKIAATGHVTGVALMQLRYRGLNATAALAQYLGKTQAEIEKMVSAGKISFEDFSNAMREYFGDAATAANKTFTGAMANTKAALSRIGEGFAAPLLDGIRRLMVGMDGAVDENKNLVSGFIRLFDAVNKFLEPAKKAFSEWIENNLPKALEKIDSLSAKLEDLASRGGFAALGNVGKLVAAAFGLMAGTSLTRLVSSLPIVSSAFNALGIAMGPISMKAKLIGAGVLLLAKAFMDAYQSNQEFKELVDETVALLGDALEPVLETLSGLFKKNEDGISPIGKLLEAIQPILVSVITVLLKAANMVLPIITKFLEFAMPILEKAFDILGSIFGILEPIITTLTEATGKLFDFFGGLAIDPGETLSGFADNLGVVLNEKIPDAVEKGAEGFRKFGEDMSEIFGKIGEDVGSWVSDIGEKAVEAGDSFVNGISDFFKGLPKRFGEWLDNVITKIKEWARSLWSKAVEAGQSFVNGIANTIGSLPGKALQWGIDLVSNLARGMRMSKYLTDGAASAVAIGMAEYLQHSEPKKGPLSMEHTFMPDMMQNLAEGMLENLSVVGNAAEAVAETIADGLSITPSPAYAYSGGGVGSRTYNINMTVNAADVQSFDAFVGMIERASAQYAR